MFDPSDSTSSLKYLGMQSWAHLVARLTFRLFSCKATRRLVVVRSCALASSVCRVQRCGSSSGVVLSQRPRAGTRRVCRGAAPPNAAKLDISTLGRLAGRSSFASEKARLENIPEHDVPAPCQKNGQAEDWPRHDWRGIRPAHRLCLLRGPDLGRPRTRPGANTRPTPRAFSYQHSFRGELALHSGAS